jgi:xylose isomerase
VREALTASRVDELAVPTLGAGESYRELLDDRGAFEDFDVEAAAGRGYGYAHLDQLAVEHALGAR